MAVLLRRKQQSLWLTNTLLLSWFRTLGAAVGGWYMTASSGSGQQQSPSKCGGAKSLHLRPTFILSLTTWYGCGLPHFIDPSFLQVEPGALPKALQIQQCSECGGPHRWSQCQFKRWRKWVLGKELDFTVIISQIIMYSAEHQTFTYIILFACTMLPYKNIQELVSCRHLVIFCILLYTLFLKWYK